jgi:hypothetical protein
MYDVRVLDIRTRLVHAACFEKAGRYEYGYELACERRIRQEELFPTKEVVVLCLGCLAVCG